MAAFFKDQSLLVKDPLDNSLRLGVANGSIMRLSSVLLTVAAFAGCAVSQMEELLSQIPDCAVSCCSAIQQRVELRSNSSL